MRASGPRPGSVKVVWWCLLMGEPDGPPDGPPVERGATRVEQRAQGTHSDTGAFIRTPERSGNTFGHRSIDGASSAVLLQLGTDQPRLPHTGTSTRWPGGGSAACMRSCRSGPVPPVLSTPSQLLNTTARAVLRNLGAPSKMDMEAPRRKAYRNHSIAIQFKFPHTLYK